ncbi:MAG: S41 family peptidase [Defluviitaleaceae bacterium]|nr:S41 family peptidase [Defluviitaleaceae bacterium]
MQKLFITIVLFSIMALASCSRGEAREVVLNEAQQIFMYDIDHFEYIMESNFSLFDAVYWARGVDINALVELIRRDIISNPNMSNAEFYLSASQRLMPLFGSAHFQVISPMQHDEILRRPGSILRMGRQSWALDRLRQPHVIDFYSSFRLHYNYEQTRNARFFQRFDRNYFLPQRDNVNLNIIEEGRIAHVTIDSFAGHPILWEMIAIYERVADFDHLIIDLRTNAGGSDLMFFDAIVSPNIMEDIAIYGFQFFVDGKYSEMYAQLPPWGGAMGLNLTDVRRIGEILPIGELLTKFDIESINLDDMQRMDYGFQTRFVIEAHPRGIFNYQPAFDGKMWLLTGAMMGSASEIIARTIKNMEFATLVGGITGGNFGGHRTLFALPNTGLSFIMDVFYVTDAYGRPYEAGTIPHHVNRNRMNALQTALALIEEGNYIRRCNREC